MAREQQPPPLASWMQTTFHGGEWSPFYQGRAEHPKYRTAMNVCLNGFPMEEGAWVRRPGSRLKAPTYQNLPGRIYPVEFAANEPYEVEFTNGNLRFYQGHQLVFTTDGAFTVSSVSSANPAVATLSSAATWLTGDEIMFFFDAAHPSGALPLRQRTFIVTKLTTTTFSLHDGLTGANIDGSTLAIASGTVITAKRVLRVTSPYSSGNWANVRIVQNQDMGVVLCPSIAPYALTITPGTTAGTASAALTKITFKDGPYLDPVLDSSGTASVLRWTGGTYSGPKRWTTDGTTATQGEVWANEQNECQTHATSLQWLFFVYVARVTASGGGGPLPSTTTTAPLDEGNNGWAMVDPGGVQAHVSGTISVTAGFADWVSTITYQIGDYANVSTTSYHAILSSTGVEPGVTVGWATYWEVVDSGIAVTGTGKTPVGFQSSDVGRIIRFWSQPQDYDATLLYPNGTPVIYKGSPYASTGVSSFRAPRSGVNPETSFTDPVWGALSFDTFGNFQTGTPDFYGTTSTWNPGWSPIGLSGQWSWGTITAVTSTSTATIQIDPDSAPIISPLGNPPLRTFRMGAWSDTTTYPACGSFYESRFWFGGAIANRFDTTQTFGWTPGSTIVDMSPTATSGDEQSGFSSDGTVTDACGISYTFESKDTNKIVWMEPDHSGLMCGTLGGEWLIAASTLSDPITPTSIQAKRVTKYGCANIEPRRTGLSLVFIQKFKHRVMEFLADVFSGRYTAPHLNEAAKHLAKNGVEELAYQEELAPILWARAGTGITIATNSSGMPFAGYQVVGGATTVTEANRAFKVDSLGTFNFHNEESNGTFDEWTIPDNTHSQILTSYYTNFYGLKNIHALSGDLLAMRGSDANGTGVHNAVYIFDTAGNLVRTIADDLSGVGLNETTNMCNWGSTLFGITASGYFGKSQLWLCDYTSSTAFTSQAIVNDNNFELNQLTMSANYAYCADSSTISGNGYTHIRRISLSGLSVTQIDFSGLGQVAAITYDSHSGHAIVIDGAGTVHSYSEDLSTSIASSSVGLLANITYNVNSTKRMCPGDGYMWVAVRDNDGLHWNLQKVRLSDLTIVETHNSADAPGGVNISVAADNHDTFDWVVWNNDEHGFFMVHGIHTFDFWPLPRASSLSYDPNKLVGATYRRTSAFTTESPAIIGWHRHSLGHDRTLTSIGVSSDLGGLLDHLDMVTTDGSNFYVEGLTQIFDEDDVFTDAWFVDGGLVPDAAYEDTVSAVTGIRFTGLGWLIGKTVSVWAIGLDLGDFVVDSNGTIFVPYGSGSAPSSHDYSTAGAGAYLFTAAYISANLSATDVRNGGVPYGGKFMPCCVGHTFTSEGQAVRPIAPDATGSKIGPALGELRRSHYVKALLHNTLGIAFGTDFTKMQASELKDDAGTEPTPVEPFSGVWRETLGDDYSFDSMVAWRIVRPYPAAVVSIGASIETQDA